LLDIDVDVDVDVDFDGSEEEPEAKLLLLSLLLLILLLLLLSLLSGVEEVAARLTSDFVNDSLLSSLVFIKSFLIFSCSAKYIFASSESSGIVLCSLFVY
jgi:hypothetical protein